MVARIDAFSKILRMMAKEFNAFATYITVFRPGWLIFHANRANLIKIIAF